MLRENSSSIRVSHKDVIQRKITRQNLEKLEVVQLNNNIEPNSRPSDLFDKLQEKRKIRHENTLKQLSTSLHEVNLRTEKSITLSSVELKAQLQEFQDKLSDILKSIDKLEVASYCASNFLEIQNTANKYKAEQQELIKEFYEDLIKFENKRAEENAKLLHTAGEEIRKIGYFLPYDAQVFIENEALKMNQLCLNNRRCYEDLKLTLTLVTEDKFKCFIDRVFCIRQKWVQHKLHQTYYSAVIEPDQRSSRCVFSRWYTRLELKGQELPIRCLPNETHSYCKIEDWMKNVEKVVAIITTFGKNLTELYRKTIKAIYNGFTGEVEEIKGGLGLTEAMTIEERSIKPLVFEIQGNKLREIEDMETQWQNTLEEVRTQVKTVADFVQALARLWDEHSDRVCESKKLILRALEKAEQNNQAPLQELEIKLNLNLDALKQEHVLSKLEKAYEVVLANLDELRVKQEAIHLENVSIVEDFYRMMNLEADILSADIQEFFYEITVIKFINNYSQQFRFLRETDFGGKSLIRIMKACAQQLQNLKYWKQGIWVALESAAAKSWESLRPGAENWVKSRIDILTERKSIQLDILDKRFQRIKVEFYEKRIAEIKAHQEMVEKHKEKIEANLKKSREDLKNLIADSLENITKLTEELFEIESNAKIEILPGILRGNQKMVERKKAELEAQIQHEFERFRVQCEIRMSDNQQITVNFMKSIKLFQENGNYSSEEAKTIINLLEENDKEVNTDFKSVIKDSIKPEDELLRKVSSLFTPTIALFDLLHEEALFYQEVQKRVKNFSAHVDECLRNLKLDFDFFNEHYNRISERVKNPESTLSESTEQLWNFLTQLLYKFISTLLYPVRLSGSSTASSEEERQENEGESDNISPCYPKGKYLINFTNFKKVPFREPKKPEDLGCKDYQSELFSCKIPLEANGTFMANISKNFSEELDFLQRAACNFYKKIQEREIVVEYLAPESYEVFIDGILAKIRHCGDQVQKFWLDLILDFLPVLGQIKLLANDFLRKKINDYKDSALKALKNYEADFKDCIETRSCENAKDFDDLDSKLLPLHGYPHNAHLLEELEELVVRRVANQQIQWETAFKSFKNQLNCFRVHHVQEKLEIRRIEADYNRLRETLFGENLGDNLLDEILNICKNGGFCVKQFSRDNFAFSGNEAQKFENEDLKKKFGTLRDCVQQMRKVAEKARDQTPLKSSSSKASYKTELGESVEPCKLKINVIQEIIDFHEGAFRATKSLEENIRYLREFAESQEKFHEEEIIKWLNKWKFNVKKILKLYRVKEEVKTPILVEVTIATGRTIKAKTEDLTK